MPELAAFYFLGLIVTAAAGTFFGLKQRANYYSKSYQILQVNLKKIGLRWNELNLSVDPLQNLNESMKPQAADDLQNEEYKKARLSSFVFLSLACVLSWLGLFF